ncbi:MAG: histidine kinase [Acidobacteria bacterium]|nr:histidine kinase [Acidobacteriota bacterium]
MDAKSMRQAGGILAFWGAETIYSAVWLHYRFALSSRPLTWAECFKAEAIWTVPGLLLTPAIVWLAKRFPLDRAGWVWNGLLHMGFSVVFIAAININWHLFGALRKPDYLLKGFSFQRLFEAISMGFDAPFAIYWGIVLAVLAADYYRRYQASLVEASQLQTQLVQAQLQALRMRLDPHFLFNALHSISELVHEDPEAAERMIARLSDLLRRSIDNAGSQEVPLREELDFLDLYLEIEKTRFDDRLVVERNIAPDTETAMVPNLILQPLVENAIRHGIGKKLSGGKITISSGRENGEMWLSVADNGAGFAGSAPQHEGVGLSATRGRLERLYGSEQRMELKAREPGAEVRIVIPYRRESAPQTRMANASD